MDKKEEEKIKHATRKKVEIGDVVNGQMREGVAVEVPNELELIQEVHKSQEQDER